MNRRGVSFALAILGMTGWSCSSPARSPIKVGTDTGMVFGNYFVLDAAIPQGAATAVVGGDQLFIFGGFLPHEVSATSVRLARDVTIIDLQDRSQLRHTTWPAELGGHSPSAIAIDDDRLLLLATPCKEATTEEFQTRCESGLVLYEYSVADNAWRERRSPETILGGPSELAGSSRILGRVSDHVFVSIGRGDSWILAYGISDDEWTVVRNAGNYEDHACVGAEALYLYPSIQSEEPATIRRYDIERRSFDRFAEVPIDGMERPHLSCAAHGMWLRDLKTDTGRVAWLEESTRTWASIDSSSLDIAVTTPGAIRSKDGLVLFGNRGDVYSVTAGRVEFTHALESGSVPNKALASAGGIVVISNGSHEPGSHLNELGFIPFTQ